MAFMPGPSGSCLRHPLFCGRSGWMAIQTSRRLWPPLFQCGWFRFRHHVGLVISDPRQENTILTMTRRSRFSCNTIVARHSGRLLAGPSSLDNNSPAAWIPAVVVLLLAGYFSPSSAVFKHLYSEVWGGYGGPLHTKDIK